MALIDVPEYMIRDLRERFRSETMVPFGFMVDLPFSWKDRIPGERNVWGEEFVWSYEPYDDGGGPALAAYRFNGCI